MKLNIHGMTYNRYRKIDLNIRFIVQINSVGFAHASIHIAHAHTSSEPAVSYYMVEVSPLFHSARDERGKSLVET